ncbi:hypothetical protein M501DRAFT_937037, partial [Patellaria atrata CBS 101060]
GIAPDFDNPTFHGQPVIVAASVGLVFSVVFASIRAYVKVYLLKKITLDDYVYLISLRPLLILLHNIAFTGDVYGYHAWEVRLGGFTKPVVGSFVLMGMRGPAMFLIKLALFSLILAAFGPFKWTKPLVYTGIIISFIGHLAPGIMISVLCRPVGGYGRENYLAGMSRPTCAGVKGPVPRASLTLGVVSVFTDFYILIIPIPAIWSLKAPLRKKLGVYLIFMSGLSACICSIFNLICRVRMYDGFNDFTYQVVPIYTLTILEVSIGLIIPCMASTAKLYRQIFHKAAPVLLKSSAPPKRTKRHVDSFGWPIISTINDKDDDTIDSDTLVNVDSTHQYEDSSTSDLGFDYGAFKYESAGLTRPNLVYHA